MAHQVVEKRSACQLSIIWSIELTIIWSIELTTILSIELTSWTIKLAVLSTELTIVWTVELAIFWTIELTTIRSIKLAIIGTIELTILSIELTIIRSIELPIIRPAKLSNSTGSIKLTLYPQTSITLSIIELLLAIIWSVKLAERELSGTCHLSFNWTVAPKLSDARRSIKWSICLRTRTVRLTAIKTAAAAGR